MKSLRAGILCFVLCLGAASRLAAQYDTALTITEVMFHAPDGNNEFIEIFNTSTTRSFDMYAYKLRYGNGSADVIFPAATNSILPPRKYAVVFESDYSLQNGIYKNLLPADALILKIGDAAFGTNGMSNTTGQSIQLLAPYYDTLDVYVYTADNPQGFSDEKIIANKNNAPANWKNAYYALGSPGKRNTVTPYGYDLWAAKFIAEPEALLTGQTARLRVDVKNIGTTRADTFTVQIYRDTNRDSVPQQSELFASRTGTPLNANDSAKYEFDFSTADTGTHYFIARVVFARDEFPANNTAYARCRVYAPQIQKSELVINEIMYGPLSPQPEWIEVYNRTAAALNMRKCKVSDRLTTAALPDTALLIPPGGYFVITADSTVRLFYPHAFAFIATKLPVFNNDSDYVVLRDSLGNVIDEVRYTSQWGGRNGYSLERRFADSASQSSANWATSTSATRATPGQKNTAVPKLIDPAVDSLYAPTGYALLGEPLLLRCAVKNRGINSTGVFTLALYHDINRDSIPQTNELLQSRQIASLPAAGVRTEQFSIGGLPEGEHNFIARVSLGGDEDSSNNTGCCRASIVTTQIQRGDIVVNEIMHSPPAGQPEWIEIYNRSPRIVNMKNFSIADARDTARVSLKQQVLPPLSYAVIAKDSTILNFFSFAVPLIVAPLPVLNNEGDKIILLDSLNRVIDSLSYEASWGGSSGYSLERIWFDSASIHQTNWKTCTSSLKGTPGTKNTAAPKIKDISVTELKTTAVYFTAGNPVRLRCTVMNSGINALPASEVHFFYDANNDSIPQSTEFLLAEDIDGLPPKYSKTFEVLLPALPPGSQRIFARAAAEGDEDTTNNAAACIARVVQLNEYRGDIVINEIMFAPSANEPEWIEIYNRAPRQINLRGYRVADNSDTATVSHSVTMLAPFSYAVIAKDSSIKARYSFTAPLIVAPFPALNNEGDKLLLLDSLNRVLDSLVFDARRGQPGYSLERVSPDTASTDSLNWRPCAYAKRGSPGLVNSVTRKSFDLAITHASVFPANPARGDTVSLECTLVNAGFNAGFCRFTISRILPQDSTTVFTTDTFLFLPDSVVFLKTPRSFVLGEPVQFRFSVLFAEDENTENNSVTVTVTPSARRHDVFINEIMCSPKDDEPEWIELWNSRDEPVDLFKWSLRDSLNTPSTATINVHHILPARGFAVIAKDSSIRQYYGHSFPFIALNALPSLNNTKDAIRLYDPVWAEVDFFEYSIVSNPGNKSIERDVQDTAHSYGPWLLSISRYGATPGYSNSITLKENDCSVAALETTPFSPVKGDSISVTAIMYRNHGPWSIQGLLSFTFRVDGSIVSSQQIPVELLRSPSSFSFSNPVKVPLTGDEMEITVTFFSAIDPDTSNDYQIIRLKSGVPPSSVLISEIMYQPRANEPEWVELYNATAEQVNIKGWSLSKLPGGYFPIGQNDVFIEPNGYIILARDSLRGYRGRFHIVPYLSLRNDADTLHLFSLNAGTVDRAGWGTYSAAMPGKSLERRMGKLNLPHDKQWHFSLSPSGGTPGAPNAVESLSPLPENSLLITEIMYEPAEGSCEYVEFYNNTDTPLQLGGAALSINGAARHYLADSLSTLPPRSYYVLAADSSLFVNYPALRGKNNIRVAMKSSLGLSNNGAKLTVAGFDGPVTDSVAYHPSMHAANIRTTANRALERINTGVAASDTRNWSTAVGSGTPGEPNSICIQPREQGKTLTCEPNPFSPDNDGFEDFTSINFALPFESAIITLRLFDDRGRQRKRITENELVAGKGSIVYNGTDEQGNPLPMGMYILLLEAKDAKSDKTAVHKYILVSARKL